MQSVAEPGFPRGGGANSGGCQHTILSKFPKNCMKLKEFGPPGGTRVPLRSATGNGISVNAAFITARKRSLQWLFLQVSLSTRGGACVVLFLGGMCGFIQGGVHGFILGGMCGFILGGMCGFIWGCVVLFGGHAWFYLGGMRGFIWGGMHGFSGGACMVFSVFLDTMRYGQ